jgi:hypothetical protein
MSVKIRSWYSIQDRAHATHSCTRTRIPYTPYTIHSYTHTPMPYTTSFSIHPYTHTPINPYTHTPIHLYTHTPIYAHPQVCDIQGVCDRIAYRYTDPAIHSTKHKGRYGRTDRYSAPSVTVLIQCTMHLLYSTMAHTVVYISIRHAVYLYIIRHAVYIMPHSVYTMYPFSTDRGQDGIEKFYRTHECNEICLKLGLPMRNCREVRNRFRERQSSSMSRDRESSSLVSVSRCNTNTSDVSIERTQVNGSEWVNGYTLNG